MVANANANAVAVATGDDENAVASGAGHVNTQAPQPQPQQRSWKIIVPAVCVASAIIAAFATAFSPRSSSVVSSNAAAAVPKEALSRYVNVGNGGCRNATNADDPYQYVWYLFEDVEITAEECAGTCECVRKSKKVEYRGFTHYVLSGSGYCYCHVDYFVDNRITVLEKLQNKCEAIGFSEFPLPATGPITRTNGGDPSSQCYSLKAKATKAPRATKSPKLRV